MHLYYTMYIVKDDLDGKDGKMEDMNLNELVRELAEENQTRKILEIMRDCENLEEAIKRVSELLKK